jgi:hypothetical protein
LNGSPKTSAYRRAAEKKTSTQEMRGLLYNIMDITLRERQFLDRRELGG